MCRTLVFSDSHIGDPRFKDNALVQKMLMEESFDKLVMNGDVVDLWTGKMKDIIKDPLYQLIKKIASEKEVIWIIGNHDYKIEKFKKLGILPSVTFVNSLAFTDNGRNILILHGNQVYAHQNKSWCNRLMAKFNICLWKHLGIDFQRKFDGLGWYESYVAGKRNKVIQQFGSGIATLIIGHTHVVGTCHLNTTTLFDLGSSVLTRSYAIVENGEVSIKLEQG